MTAAKTIKGRAVVVAEANMTIDLVLEVGREIRNVDRAPEVKTTIAAAPEVGRGIREAGVEVVVGVVTVEEEVDRGV